MHTVRGSSMTYSVETHTHIYTHTHTYTHTHIHTYTHTHIHTYTHTQHTHTKQSVSLPLSGHANSA